MKQEELRELIRNSIQRPVQVCMDDGRSYLIKHPDFALVAPDALVLSSGPEHDFGASFVICWYDHISRVEVNRTAERDAKA